MPRRSIEATERTRREILLRAADLASVEGLDGLTIGRLGSAISMSKSGVFAHFGSKEDLQLAVIEVARAAFEREVFEPAMQVGPGIARLRELADGWVGYLERGPFRGGCFFSAVAPEVDDRPGRVRDRIIELTRLWLDEIENEVRSAIDLGELAPATDPGQLAFEIHAFVSEANWSFQLHGDADAFRRARVAIRRAIASATDGDA